MNRATLICGDALEVLREQPAESVQMCVTSPPYWKLRDYGVAGQLGLEASPQEYVEKLVSYLAEVHRVLRKDGTLWLNLGDTYASAAFGCPTPDHSGPNRTGTRGRQAASSARAMVRGTPLGWKEKDLIGIPWRVAIALHDLGWYLRRDIIWQKPNPMPEAVRDRPTTAHEYVFLLSKSERYYYDWKAIIEPVTGNAHDRGNGVNPKAKKPSGWETGPGRDHRSLRGRYPEGDRQKLDRPPRMKQNESFSAAMADAPWPPGERNARSVWEIGWTEPDLRAALAFLNLPADDSDVWTVTTQAYPGIHYATFPEELARRCIVAGSPPECCAVCRAPMVRILGKPERRAGRSSGNKARHLALGAPPETALNDERWHGDRLNTHMGSSVPWESNERPTLGWKRSCKHEGGPNVPAVVLDPFAGSGTTGAVAVGNNRDAILIDLKPQYLRDQEARIGQLFVTTRAQ